MKPIGTITNFYPFLSEDTRKIVESTLRKAEGYDDFVSIMVDIVLTQDEITDLTHFTVIQAWTTANPTLFNKLRPRFSEHVVLEPWSFFLFEGTQEEYRKIVSSSIDNALENVTENWIRLHLLMIAAHRYYPKIKRHSFLEKAKELVESQPELKCFSTELYIRSGWFARVDADIKGAMNQFEQAMEIAESHDDVIRKNDAQTALATCLKEADVFHALSLMEGTFQSFRSLGADYLASVEAFNMGLLHTIIGEYDLAVEFYLEANRMAEPSWVNRRANAIIFCRIYCDIDLPKEALEWAKQFMGWDELTPMIIKRLPKSRLDPDPSPDPLLAMAVTRTVIQLGQLDGVPQLLSEISALVLEKGVESDLLEYNFVSGLFELSIGNLDAGLQSMSDALMEAERLQYQVYINSILLALTKAEVKHFKKLDSSGSTDSSGQWMTRLGIHARENNFPGIRMQHALLKAEYQEEIGESEAAILTLQDALTFTDSPGVKTLRERILKRLEELETSVNA